MHVSDFLGNWTEVGLPWTKQAAAYRVWIIKKRDGSKYEGKLRPIGVTAKSLLELKEKIRTSFDPDLSVETDDVSVLRMSDGTSIMDDDFLRQIPCSEDLIALLPGQSWEVPEMILRIGSNHVENNQAVRRKGTSDDACSGGSGGTDYRYCVPAPRGEVARLTVDLFREKPTDAGCLRLTAATAGEAGLAVYYELRLNGVKGLIHYALRWTAVLLTFGGKAMVETGEMIRRRLG